MGEKYIDVSNRRGHFAPCRKVRLRCYRDTLRGMLEYHDHLVGNTDEGWDVYRATILYALGLVEREIKRQQEEPENNNL